MLPSAKAAEALIQAYAAIRQIPTALEALFTALTQAQGQDSFSGLLQGSVAATCMQASNLSAPSDFATSGGISTTPSV